MKTFVKVKPEFSQYIPFQKFIIGITTDKKFYIWNRETEDHVEFEKLTEWDINNMIAGLNKIKRSLPEN